MFLSKNGYKASVSVFSVLRDKSRNGFFVVVLLVLSIIKLKNKGQPILLTFILLMSNVMFFT